jgi:hypothetical protein
MDVSDCEKRAAELFAKYDEILQKYGAPGYKMNFVCGIDFGNQSEAMFITLDLIDRDGKQVKYSKIIITNVTELRQLEETLETTLQFAREDLSKYFR